jgi:hypothetical protein
MFFASVNDFLQIPFIEDPLQLLCPATVVEFNEFINIIDGETGFYFIGQHGRCLSM